MSLTEKDVDYISGLARIRLSDEDKKKFTDQLHTVLEYIDKLSELDTESVEPTAHILPVNNVFREDKVVASKNTELAIKQSPFLTDGLFEVPKVIE